MLMSPESYIEFECAGKSYGELLRIRDELLDEIRAFESGNVPEKERNRIPSPADVYRLNLEILGLLFRRIGKAYRRETARSAWGDEEEDGDEE